MRGRSVSMWMCSDKALVSVSEVSVQYTVVCVYTSTCVGSPAFEGSWLLFFSLPLSLSRSLNLHSNFKTAH